MPNAMAKLSLIYPRLMKFDYENTRTARNNDIEATVELHEQAPKWKFKLHIHAEYSRIMSE